jgi:hypothetical protein
VVRSDCEIVKPAVPALADIATGQTAGDFPPAASTVLGDEIAKHIVFFRTKSRTRDLAAPGLICHGNSEVILFVML